jgi:NADPH:quinone reductase-like Zn-dependent oxidoreductase
MQLLPFIFRARPAVPEMDFAGTVECTSSSVTDMPPGTPVFGSIPVGQHVRSTSGALAGSIVVERDAVVRVPRTVALSEAAGVGIAGSTALACVRAAKVKMGDAVLVNGAAGGIGHLVLQMCLEKVGASGRVVGVCSGQNTSWVRELERASRTDNAAGSLRVIDREAEPLVPRLVRDYGAERFDVVIDAAGIQEVYESCAGFLKEGKPYVTVGPRLGSYTYAGMLGMLGTTAKNVLWPRILGGTPRPYVQVAAVASLETLEELAGMMERGALRVHVGTLVDWEDVMKVSDFAWWECTLLNLDRHTRSFLADMLVVKSLLLLANSILLRMRNERVGSEYSSHRLVRIMS